MEQLVAWLNAEKELHPVLESGIAQFQFVHIHPFRDGNGRTSRLLSTLCLYRAGYDFKKLFSISEYYDRDRKAFYDALQGVRERGMDFTGWLEYFVSGLSIQLAEVVSKGKDAIKKDLIVRKQALSPRQGEIIEILLERRNLTIAELEDSFSGISRRTLQRDLRLLQSKGIVRTKGASATDPTKRYELAVEQSERTITTK
jgi:Fic family protein